VSGQAIAFRYRRRYGDAVEVAATVGDAVVLDERHEYVVALDRPLDPLQSAALSEIGGELIGPNLALLSFGNFVGTATFLGVRLHVISTKLGDGGSSRLLDEVSQLASTLVFGWRSPTTLEGSTDKARHSPVPYHQLQALREAMLRRKAGSRLQDWLDHIARNPVRRFDSHRPVVAAHRVRRLDHQALTSTFARLDRLATVPAGNTLLATNRLADALTFGHPPKRHFPAAIAAPQVAPRRFVWNPTVRIMVIVEPGGHVGRLRLSLSTCPRGGCQEHGIERWSGGAVHQRVGSAGTVGGAGCAA
jgi:hypothetical protein